MSFDACPNCGYNVVPASPRYDGPPAQSTGTVRLKPRAELDAETLAILESARRTARIVKSWPSWKLGRCNCRALPRTQSRVIKSSCIDRQPAAANPTSPASVNLDAECSKHLEVAHYVVVRADLPHGSQVAQCVHAAGESARTRVEPGTIAVALHARDELHLRDVAARLERAGIPHHVVEECDGEWMSIGVVPTTDRAAVRKVLSSLPLVR